MNLLFDVGEILRRDVTLEVLGQSLGGTLQIPLVIFEDHRLVVLLQVVGKHIRVHERLPALAEDVNGPLEELHLNPAHVVLLHLFHLLLDRRVQLVLKLE